MPWLADSSSVGLRVMSHNKRCFIASAMGIAVAVIIKFLEFWVFCSFLDLQAKLATPIPDGPVVLHHFQSRFNNWHEGAQIASPA